MDQNFVLFIYVPQIPAPVDSQPSTNMHSLPPLTVSQEILTWGKEVTGQRQVKAVHTLGFPGGASVKNPHKQEAQETQIQSLGRSPEGRHGNPLQYSCLENPMDRGAWRARADRVARSGTRLKRLSTQALMKVSGSELGMGKPWLNQVYFLKG